MPSETASTAAGEASAHRSDPVKKDLRTETWLIERPWASQIVGPGAPNWFLLEKDARACPVKIGHRRTTWRVSLGNATVYAKTYEQTRFTEWCRRLAGVDPARREWAASRRAAARGVPAIKPVAYGRVKGIGAKSAFLSEGERSAASLADVWSGRAHDPDGRTAVSPVEKLRREDGKLIASVTGLLARAHENGIAHRDGHPGNILVRGADGGNPEAVFVDMGACSVSRRPVARRRAVQALAQLNHYFRLEASQTQRLRFLRSYLAARPSLGMAIAGDGAAVRQWAEAVSKCTTRHAEQLARHRDRRLRVNGKYFATFRVGGGWTARVALQLERRRIFRKADVSDRSRDEWVDILGRMSIALRTSTLHECAKLSGKDRVLRNAPSGLRMVVVGAESLHARIVFTLRGSPHRKAFFRCHRRRHRDLPAELVLGFMEHRRLGMIDACVLICPEVAMSGNNVSQ